MSPAPYLVHPYTNIPVDLFDVLLCPKCTKCFQTAYYCWNCYPDIIKSGTQRLLIKFNQVEPKKAVKWVTLEEAIKLQNSEGRTWNSVLSIWQKNKKYFNWLCNNTGHWISICHLHHIHHRQHQAEHLSNYPYPQHLLHHWTHSTSLDLGWIQQEWWP